MVGLAMVANVARYRNKARKPERREESIEIDAHSLAYYAAEVLIENDTTFRCCLYKQQGHKEPLWRALPVRTAKPLHK